MRLQLLSDLHLETERFDPAPADGAELLVLAGDIDSRWDGLARFAGWPCPIVFVAGNHEFDRRDLVADLPALRERCASHGMRLLERESMLVTDAAGARIRLLGATRWCDFDLYGPSKRAKALRAGQYFMKLQRATIDGAPLDADAVRGVGLASRAWLAGQLAAPRDGWDRTVVVTHFAPSLRSADPRYGAQAATASFCNADDDLVVQADLWLHGHLHCQHDYRIDHADGAGSTRVVCNPRGHERRGEPAGHRPRLLIEV